MDRVSFHTLWEQIQSHSPDESSPLESSGGDTRAIQVIKTGLNLRGEDGSKTFWDDFMQVCNDAEGLAELLEVRPDQIAKWSSRIRDMMHKVEKDDDNQSAGQKNVLPTGMGTPNPF